LTITSPAELTAVSGAPYAYSLSSSGGQGPYTYLIKNFSFPDAAGSSGGSSAWLKLSPSGQIGCLNPAVGTYKFTVEVTDSCSSGKQVSSKTFTVMIAPPSGGSLQDQIGKAVKCSSLKIESPAELIPGLATWPYNYSFSSSGGQAPYTYSTDSWLFRADSPPGCAWLKLSPSGKITGTFGTSKYPQAYPFIVTVTDNCPSGKQVSSKTVSIMVYLPPEGSTIKFPEPCQTTPGNTNPGAPGGTPGGPPIVPGGSGL
jgi:hypothetical protein